MFEMRIGVPLLVATTSALKSWTASTRPRVLSTVVPFLLHRAARISTFSATSESRTWVIESPYEFSFSMSTTMWISRARPPARLTSPTPLTVWMARAICLSLSSVSVRRLIASDDTMSDITIPRDLLPSDGRFGSGPSKVRPEAMAALAEVALEDEPTVIQAVPSEMRA